MTSQHDAHSPAAGRKILILAGPSGSGKGRVGERSALPVVNLDDFYHDHDFPGLPRAFGIVDWDDPASWNKEEAVSALEVLCARGSCEIPTYSIPESRRTGVRTLDVSDAPLIIAEGIFAPHIVADLAARGLLADALVLDRPALLVFALRFLRDISQGRKSPLTLVRRGLALALRQHRDVESWASLGLRRVPLRPALARVRALASVGAADARSRTVGPSSPGADFAHTITVSAVCFVSRFAPHDGDAPAWHVLGVRKRGTTAFMQPGGKPEKGESPVDTAVREIKEELAVTLSPSSLEELGTHTTKAANEANTALKATVFLAPEVHNPHEFEARAEIDEVRWFPLSSSDPAIAPLFAEFVLPILRERLEEPEGPGR